MEEAGSEGSASGRGRKTQTASGRGGVHKALSAKRQGAAPGTCPASGGPGVGTGGRCELRAFSLFFRHSPFSGRLHFKNHTIALNIPRLLTFPLHVYVLNRISGPTQWMPLFSPD